MAHAFNKRPRQIENATEFYYILENIYVKTLAARVCSILARARVYKYIATVVTVVKKKKRERIYRRRAGNNGPIVKFFHEKCEPNNNLGWSERSNRFENRAQSRARYSPRVALPMNGRPDAKIGARGWTARRRGGRVVAHPDI